jgi:hypothetical protein
MIEGENEPSIFDNVHVTYIYIYIYRARQEAQGPILI